MAHAHQLQISIIHNCSTGQNASPNFPVVPQEEVAVICDEAAGRKLAAIWEEAATREEEGGTK